MRPRGGVIGASVAPATTSANSTAGGVWHLREAEQLRRASAWPFPPLANVSSALQLWLDAADTSKLYDATSSGSLVPADGAVARWEDKSGNARHFTQSTSSYRPIRKAIGQNGLSTIRFDGSNDYMSCASSTATFSFLHSAACTIFIVAKPAQSSDINASAILIDNSFTSGGSSQTGFCLFVDDRVSASRNNAILATNVNTSGTDYYYVGVSNNAISVLNAFQVISFVGDMQNATNANRGVLRVNGATVSTSQSTAGSRRTGDAQYDLTIAATGQPGFGYANSDYAEIIIYNTALSNGDRSSIESYLIAKWGVS